MTRMSDEAVNELHHRIIEGAKASWDAGRSGRPFHEHLREAAIDEPAVKGGRVAVQVTSGPGARDWSLTCRAIEA